VKSEKDVNSTLKGIIVKNMATYKRAAAHKNYTSYIIKYALCRMSQFMFGYAGNKRTEYKHFKDNLNLDGIRNMIEPCCGTSAISFNIWFEHKKSNCY
jgi:hypothetical protein